MIAQLAYAGFEVSDLEAWERFGTGVLGLEKVESPFLAPSGEGEGRGGSPAPLAFRMDGRVHRLLFSKGPAEDVAFLGWEVADEATLDQLAAKLRAAGVVVEDGDAGARRVRKLLRCQDPSGLSTELVVGLEAARAPFKSQTVRSGFVADERGFGHVVLAAREPQATIRFYCDLLGLRLSDRIVTRIHGFDVDITFLHTNARHHSLALGGPQKRRIHHFMLEVKSMDDVGLAFDRALKNGSRIMQTLGRHPNDRMFSFYAKTPSGFQFEYGWGGRDVDDATWEPTTYDHISEWGHHPPQFVAGGKP